MLVGQGTNVVELPSCQCSRPCLAFGSEHEIMCEHKLESKICDVGLELSTARRMNVALYDAAPREAQTSI